MSTEKDNNRELFLNALDFCMHKYDMKAIELANITGIARSRISEILNSKYNPGLKVQSKIAQAFNLSLVDFLSLGKEAPTLRFLDIMPTTGHGVSKLVWVNKIIPKLMGIDEAGEKVVEAVINALYFADNSDKTRATLGDAKAEALKTVIDSMIKE